MASLASSLLAVTCLASLARHASGFSGSIPLGLAHFGPAKALVTSGPRPRFLRTTGALSAACQLNQVETKAVQRFTKDFDKLCKTCPSRIQPRADTLTEMILGLPEDEMKLLAAKVALRLSGHDAAALMGGAAAVAASEGVGSAMPAAAAAPQMGMEKEMGMGGKKMKEDKKMEVEMEISKMEKKAMKLRKKIKEREMDMAVYKGELDFINGLEGGEEHEAAGIDALAREILTIPEAMGEMDGAEMTKELVMKMQKVMKLRAEEREIRSLKVQEKILKCTRKVKECSMELSMMPAPAGVAAAPAGLAC